MLDDTEKFMRDLRGCTFHTSPDVQHSKVVSFDIETILKPAGNSERETLSNKWI